MPNDVVTIAKNLDTIQAQMATACERAGRQLNEVTLIAVTKTIPLELLQEAQALWVDHPGMVFGENRVQELLSKYDHLPDTDWHMIGTLQRNKVKAILDKVSLIHSVDSLKLATEINRQAAKLGKIQAVLLEVNIANEPTKHGVAPAALPTLVQACAQLPNLQVIGLMTLAPYASDPETNRPHFKHMRDLLRALQPDNPHMQHLSMGMTGDYTVAIEEGATMVRIGTGIFGQR